MKVPWISTLLGPRHSVQEIERPLICRIEAGHFVKFVLARLSVLRHVRTLARQAATVASVKTSGAATSRTAVRPDFCSGNAQTCMMRSEWLASCISRGVCLRTVVRTRYLHHRFTGFPGRIGVKPRSTDMLIWIKARYFQNPGRLAVDIIPTFTIRLQTWPRSRLLSAHFTRPFYTHSSRILPTSSQNAIAQV